MRPPVTITDLVALKEETDAFARTLVPKTEGATLVTLSGELGAGKTAFTQALAEALGVTESVTSPTFVLAKSYALPAESTFRTLLHIDAYRLTGGVELGKIGFIEAYASTSTLIVLEWPERVVDLLPKPEVAITLTLEDDGSRIIRYA